MSNCGKLSNMGEGHTWNFYCTNSSSSFGNLTLAKFFPAFSFCFFVFSVTKKKKGNEKTEIKHFFVILEPIDVSILQLVSSLYTSIGIKYQYFNRYQVSILQLVLSIDTSIGSKKCFLFNSSELSKKRNS